MEPHIHEPIRLKSKRLKYSDKNTGNSQPTKDNSQPQPTVDLRLKYTADIERKLTGFLTHCGRVRQICVFNTVKLGTSASSP